MKAYVAGNLVFQFSSSLIATQSAINWVASFSLLSILLESYCNGTMERLGKYG
ncbi:protein of unknown function [Thermococcus nautili]|nr:protein of unknown function [Thermococcus nautili]